MKRTMATATFMLLGAGTLGASALPLHARGSDTLFVMINAVLDEPNCGGGADELTYVGGGSGNAQSQMQRLEQEVGPMSSFMSTSGGTSVCNHPADGANAEGLIWSLDGLSMMAQNGSVTSCGAADGLGELRRTGSITALDLNEDGDGVAGDGDVDLPAGVVNPYPIASWKDVINILYFGIHNNNRGPNSSALDGQKMCDSDLRYTLANNWSANFEGGCASGGCTRIEHMWRRGDDSGTTDVFQSLVCGSASDPDCQFCNGPIEASGATATKNDDTVDFDPIRRSCNTAANPAAGQKAVCSTYMQQTLTGCSGQVKCTSASATAAELNRAWSLGLVQPVTPPENLIADDQYPTTACSTISPTKKLAAFPVGFPTHVPRCPCGEPSSGNECLLPVDSGGNWGCRNSLLKSSKARAQCSPKVYNYEIRRDDGTMATDPGTFVPPRQYMGSGYRMRLPGFTFAAGGTGITCNELDATTQIGCLSSAIGCTIGFAGREGCETVGGVDCLEINDVEPTNTNVRNGSFVLTRNLYLNTMWGFENVTGVAIGTDAVPNTFDPDGAGPLVASGVRTAAQLQAQVNLAGCLAQENLTEPIIVNAGYITLYDLNDGTDAKCARCQDFNSGTCGPVDTEACANNEPSAGLAPANGVPLPDHTTTTNPSAGIFNDTDSDGVDPGIVCERCGDGNVDIGETCDDGNRLDGDACPADCTL